MVLRRALFTAVFTLTAVLTAGAAEGQNAEKAEPSMVDAETRRRLAETVAKMQELDRQWKAERKAAPAEKPLAAAPEADGGEKTPAERKQDEKAVKKAEKERHKELKRAAELAKKEERAREPGGDYSRAHVYYNGHAVREGQWTEIGGVSSRSSFSSSSPGASVREGSSSSTSIGVRATVIRLDGPPED